MVGGVAFDLVLRLVLAGSDRVTLELYLGCDDPRDVTADSPSFRVPAHVIACLQRSPFRQNSLRVAPVELRLVDVDLWINAC